MEPVQDRALVKELALGRVHVLGLQGVVLMQPAGAEADDAAARVREWKQQPTREVVAAAPAGEPGRPQLLGSETLRPRLGAELVAAGCKAEPEFAADLLAEAALDEVRAHPFPDLALPQAALVEAR